MCKRAVFGLILGLAIIPISGVVLPKLSFAMSALQISKEKCASELGSNNQQFGECVISYLKILKKHLTHSKTDLSSIEIDKMQEIQSAAWKKTIGLFPQFMLKATATAVATQVVSDAVAGQLTPEKRSAPTNEVQTKGGKRLTYGPTSGKAPSVKVQTPLPEVGNFGHNVPMGWTLK